MQHSERQCPKVTVDIIIEILDWWEDRDIMQIRQQLGLGLQEIVKGKPYVPGIVLIERHNTPQGFALPGGFVDVGERAIDAAVREACEETTLRVTGIKQFHTYTSPGRDPRGHGITIVYIAQAMGRPQGEDDAKRAFIVDPICLPDKLIKALCFDHREIITDYVHFRLTGEMPTRE